MQREFPRALVLNLWQSTRYSRTAQNIFLLDIALLLEGHPRSYLIQRLTAGHRPGGSPEMGIAGARRHLARLEQLFPEYNRCVGAVPNSALGNSNAVRFVLQLLQENSYGVARSAPGVGSPKYGNHLCRGPIFDQRFCLSPTNAGLAFSIHLVLPLLTSAGGAACAQSVEDLNSPALDQHVAVKPSSPLAAGLGASAAKPLRVNVDLVLVPVTVADAMNRPVLELSQRDFGLYDSGKRQDIKFFFTESAPISIGLILDFSKSMENKIERERQAVVEFLKNVNPKDDYFAIAVSSKPQLIADTTDSLEELQSSIEQRLPQGGTALLDSIAMGLARMRSARYQRRALLIISDGGDNSSRYVLCKIKSLVRESDVGLYAIGLFDTALFKTYEEFMGKRWLREITDGSAGRTLTVDSIKKLPEAAAEISRELRQEYILGYSPTDAAANANGIR